MKRDVWREKIRSKALPYGKWICRDGREVMFNRAYIPILEKRPGEAYKVARAGEWVRYFRSAMFYDDGTRDKAKRAIAEFESFTGLTWSWDVAQSVVSRPEEGIKAFRAGAYYDGDIAPSKRNDEARAVFEALLACKTG
jgi:hypothetical protein